MSIRVRRPATDRLELTQGDFLIVKRDLTAGEYREQLRASTKPVSVTLGGGAGAAPRMPAGALEIDPVAAGVALVQAYLLDWSFTDADGRPIVIADQPPQVVAAALDLIDHASYMEVQQAIQAHQTAQEGARGADPTSATASAKTLVSAG